jgi:iron complex transport system substrate-binding protein
VRPFKALAALLLALALTAPARAELSARDDRGVTIRLAKPPQRIITLLPSLTETVCALKACERLVGTDRYSNWPDSVRALPKTGGLEDANVERIVSLKPDLVFASGTARIIPRLEALGLTVVALEARSHADMKRVIGVVAALTGQPGGDALWRRLQAEITVAAERVPPSIRGQRVYFEVESAPYAAGPSSHIGESLSRLGMGNIVPATMGPFPKLNPEFVVRAQPDIVIGAETNVSRMAGRPGWATLPALQNGRVCAFDSPRFEVLIRPGPRLGEGAMMLADCLVALAKKDKP